jgi:CBS domain-containing protein
MRSQAIASIGHRVRFRGPLPPQAALPSGDRRVGDCMNAVIARVPGWFSVAQARRVAELKGVEHVLVDDKSGASGAASLAALKLAPAGDLLARWTMRSSASVDADSSLEVAEALLRAERAACLPVTAGGLLVGTISLADLAVGSDDHLPHAA